MSSIVLVRITWLAEKLCFSVGSKVKWTGHGFFSPSSFWGISVLFVSSQIVTGLVLVSLYDFGKAENVTFPSTLRIQQD